ncbi:MAG: hypothetical protein ACI4T2_00495 [Christensenellales bacterium]
MEKEKKIKNKIKIAFIAVTAVVLSLIIILIVQNVQLHKLENQKYEANQELVEIEQKNNVADKTIEELSDPEHNEKYYEQEENYGGDKDYIL